MSKQVILASLVNLKKIDRKQCVSQPVYDIILAKELNGDRYFVIVKKPNAPTGLPFWFKNRRHAEEAFTKLTNNKSFTVRDLKTYLRTYPFGGEVTGEEINFKKLGSILFEIAKDLKNLS